MKISSPMFCSVCHITLDSLTVQYGFGLNKISAFVCSPECKQFFQYSVGFSHGIILFELLSKLCPNLSLFRDIKVSPSVPQPERTPHNQSDERSQGCEDGSDHAVKVGAEYVSCSEDLVSSINDFFENDDSAEADPETLNAWFPCDQNSGTEASSSGSLVQCGNGLSYCPVCSATFPFGEDVLLAQHLSEVHADKVVSQNLLKGKKQRKAGRKDIGVDKHNRVLQSRSGDNSKHFKCDRCQKSYASILYLDAHRRRMHSIFKRPSAKCETCGIYYKNETALGRHIAKRHPKEKLVGTDAPNPKTKAAASKDISCSLCDAKFTRIDYLIGHRQKIHGLCSPKKTAQFKTQKEKVRERHKKKYPCEKCGQSFTRCALLKHVRVFHDVKEPVKCDECNKTLNNAFHLQQHKRTHWTSSVCHICGAKYKSTHGLESHLETHNGTTKSYVCEVCGAGFFRKSSYERHVKFHSDSLPRFACDSCPKAFSTDYYRNAHTLKHHHRGMFFTNRLKTLEEVGYQVNQQHVDRHLNLQCVMCGEKLVNGTCIAHPLTCLLSFPCNHCEAVLNHVDSLCQHLKEHNVPLVYTSSTKNYFSASSGKRDETNMKFSCKVCDKSFKTLRNLVQHEQMHREKLLACHICFKKFKFKTSLRSHLETSHSDKKPFQCLVCLKAFKRKQYLTCHELVHNLTESPHRCQICSKGFSRKSVLPRHYRQMHPDVVVPEATGNLSSSASEFNCIQPNFVA